MYTLSCVTPKMHLPFLTQHGHICNSFTESYYVLLQEYPSSSTSFIQYTHQMLIVQLP
jgi:hypothetical protein